MGDLIDEVQEWNSPVLGAFLVWKFTIGYCDSHANGDSPPALLPFLALPLLTNVKLSETISNRRPNLQSYIMGFEDLKESDLLIGVHERVDRMRNYTTAAIDIATSLGLVYWDIDSGKLFTPPALRKPRRGNSLKPSVVKLGKKAEILGGWFSQHSVENVAAYLRVVL